MGQSLKPKKERSLSIAGKWGFGLVYLSWVEEPHICADALPPIFAVKSTLYDDALKLVAENSILGTFSSWKSLIWRWRMPLGTCLSLKPLPAPSLTFTCIHDGPRSRSISAFQYPSEGKSNSRIYFGSWSGSCGWCIDVCIISTCAQCRKVADPRDGSQHTSSKDKTAQSPEDPQSVHLIGIISNPCKFVLLEIW